VACQHRRQHRRSLCCPTGSAYRPHMHEADTSPSLPRPCNCYLCSNPRRHHHNMSHPVACQHPPAMPSQHEHASRHSPRLHPAGNCTWPLATAACCGAKLTCATFSTELGQPEQVAGRQTTSHDCSSCNAAPRGGRRAAGPLYLAR
jgi:hypothetical protein